MSDHEFDEQAAEIARDLPSQPLAVRIAAACRGSGNPAALAWLAENAGLTPGSRVIDLGAGLGGPAAWLKNRYDCFVVALDPAAGAIEAAASLFHLPAVQGGADAAPMASDAFDLALLLGVLSVVEAPEAALREAGRIAAQLGVLDYCATAAEPVAAGGSTFVPSRDLITVVRESGWTVRQTTPLAVPAPRRWTEASDAVDVEPEASESEVLEAIEAGRIAPFMLIARR